MFKVVLFLFILFFFFLFFFLFAFWVASSSIAHFWRFASRRTCLALAHPETLLERHDFLRLIRSAHLDIVPVKPVLLLCCFLRGFSVLGFAIVESNDRIGKPLKTHRHRTIVEQQGSYATSRRQSVTRCTGSQIISPRDVSLVVISLAGGRIGSGRFVVRYRLVVCRWQYEACCAPVVSRHYLEQPHPSTAPRWTSLLRPQPIKPTRFTFLHLACTTATYTISSTSNLKKGQRSTLLR